MAIIKTTSGVFKNTKTGSTGKTKEDVKLSKKDQQAFDKAKTAGGFSAPAGFYPPAARGEEFAPAFEEAARARGVSQEDAFGKGNITAWAEFFGGQGGDPRSVISNDSALNKISFLDSQVQGLPNYGSSQFDLPEEGVGTGDEYDYDEILGLGGDKKKKKKGAVNTYIKKEGGGLMRAHSYDAEIDPETRKAFKAIEAMQQTSDRNTQEAISAIQGRFDQRRAEQEQSNAQGLASLKQVLNLGGSSRYAPISSQGLIGAQEAAGIRALAAIDAQERDAVAQARQAQQSGDYKRLEATLGLLEGIREDKGKAMKELSESTLETEKLMQAESAITGLVSQGITDPTKIFQTLSSQGIDVSLKDISASLGYLQPKNSTSGSFKFEANQVGPLLGMGFSMADVQQMQDDFNAGGSIEEVLQGVNDPEMIQAVKDALGIPEASNLRPGVGAKDAITEQMIRTRLFPKAASILNKGTLSDADREIIDERIAFFRDSGLSEQQILDVFSGWSADVSTPFNNSFRDILLTTQENGEGVSQALTRAGSLLANKNYKGAMNLVENQALDTIKTQDGYVGKIATENYTRKVDRIKQLLKQGGVWDGVGPLEGNFQNLLRRVKGNRATEIKAELTNLYKDMRKESAGSAVTPSEMKFLDPLFATVTDTKGNFLEKLDVFQRGILDGHNSTRRTVSLPEVQVKDILDPNERLLLYVDQVTSDNINALDI